MNVAYGSSTGLLRSRFGFEETLERLRTSIAEHELWVIGEIDPQALLARAGYRIAPARQLLFFHPRYASAVLAADPAALIDAPLKLLVLGFPDESVWTRAMEPSARLTSIAPDLARLSTEILESACD